MEKLAVQWHPRWSNSQHMRVYSMVETAKANGLDPLKYLMFLLENRPSAEMSDEELALFAPWSEKAMELCK